MVLEIPERNTTFESQEKDLPGSIHMRDNPSDLRPEDPSPAIDEGDYPNIFRRVAILTGVCLALFTVRLRL